MFLRAISARFFVVFNLVLDNRFLARTVHKFSTGMNDVVDGLRNVQSAPSLGDVSCNISSATSNFSSALPDCLNTSQWRKLHLNPIIRRFEIGPRLVESATQKRMFVHEIMAEHAFNNLIPPEFIKNETRSFVLLENIFHDDDTNLTAGQQILLADLRESLELLSKNTVPSDVYFKRSALKNKEDRMFVPANLHTQSIVVNEGCQDQSSTVTTVGAFTSKFHFKTPKGLFGIWRLLNGSVKSDYDFAVKRPVAMRIFDCCLDLANVLNSLHNSGRVSDELRAEIKIVMLMLKELNIEWGDQLSDFLEDFWSTFDSVTEAASKDGLTSESSVFYATTVAEALRQLITGLLETTNQHVRSTVPFSNIFQLHIRERAVLSQAVTAVTSAVTDWILGSNPGDEKLSGLITNRVPVHIQSLLSCYADEKIMLEDVIGAMQMLEKVTFVLPLTEEETEFEQKDVQPVFQRFRQFNAPLVIRLPSISRSRIPTQMSDQRDHVRFEIVPVLTTFGMNEKAPLAVQSGDIALEKAVDRHYSDILLSYATQTKASYNETERIQLEELCRELRAAISSHSVDILTVSAKLVRILGGVRLIMCKSAKDRTGMAVTLEQALVVKEVTGITDAETAKLLINFRTSGTRRHNTLKNIGVAKYAFVDEQLPFIPEQYRPPPGTYGKYET